MKRTFAMMLSLAMLLAALSGCNAPQIGSTPKGPEATQNNDNSSSTSAPPVIETTPTAPSQNIDCPIETTPMFPDLPVGNDKPLFQYDPYWVSDDARSYFSEREYMLYCQAVDSILSHNGIIEGIESEDECWTIWRFLLSEFIPARSMIQTYLQTSEPFIYDNGTMTLKFLTDEETCLENYTRFESRINDALSLLREDDSDWERIAKLYLYVSDHMTYGDPYTAFGINSDLYNCIVYKIGMCTEYTLYLNMLAEHAGFETIWAHSSGKEGFAWADHAWSMIRVEGQWYCFDACWQAPLHNHKKMDYFAFSTQDRYNSLAHNDPWGTVGEVEMFCQYLYTNERTELPYCETTMSESKRTALYNAVIREYLDGIKQYIPYDEIDSYIDDALSKVQNALDDGAAVGIRFEVIPGITNYGVAQLILNYSPEDLQDYPQLEYNGEWCTLPWVVLKHIDQTNLRDILYEIITQEIVVCQSVELIIL